MNQKLIKPLVIVLLFLSGTSYLKAQQSQIIPPNPDAAAFFKSTEVPVSLYTGLPNVAVPIHTIKTKELSIPIGINYNARGIQVGEMASKVGLGWALQAGGMISRQIRGKADDMPQGMMYHHYYPDVFENVGNSQEFLQNDIISGSIDELPDQFYFDVNGESGKFIIDYNDKQVVLQRFSDIKIQKNIDVVTGEILSWTVTDKFGNTYYYGKSKDGTRTANSKSFAILNYFYGYESGMHQWYGEGDRPVNSWHLMEIETFLHEKVEFFYKLEESIQYSRGYDEVHRYINYGPATPPEPELRSYFSKDDCREYDISEIRFPGGKVFFEKASSERMDRVGTYAYKNIIVTDNRDTTLKRFTFNYVYQRCNDDNNQLPALNTLDTSAKYRLFLSSVKEFSKTGDSLPPHQFVYNSTKLPSRFSNSQDNWGFYNGKSNGNFLTFLTYGNVNDRHVDTAYASAGLLQEVIYPTGGRTTFTFEHNRMLPVPFIDSLMYNNNNPAEMEGVSSGFFRDSLYYADGSYSKIIAIGENIVPLTTVNFSFVGAMPLPEEDPETYHHFVHLEKIGTEEVYYLYPSDPDQDLPLDPGMYKLIVTPANENDHRPFITGLSWLVENPTGNLGVEWYGAGKRIKRIDFWNGNTLSSTKEYEYLTDMGSTSGKMLALPNYYFIKKIFPINDGIPMMDGYGSTPAQPLAQLQGNSVGYSRVIEYVGTKTNNIGKTVTEFTVDADGGSYYRFPYNLPIDFEWVRGKALMTKVYKKNGSEYELQKSIENKYWYANWSEFPHLFAQPFLHIDSVYVYRKDRNLFYLPLFTFAPDINNPSGGPLNTKIFYQTAGSADPDSTIEKIYANGQVLTTVSKYEYNYLKHYQTARLSTFSSKQDTIRNQFTYPPDLITKTAAEQKLIDLNRIALPVKTELITKNSSNTELARKTTSVEFKDWGNNVVLPEYQKSAINAASLTTDASFVKYDSSGNPLEIVSRSGITEVYVWGYNKQYPVAKIVGSNYNTVIALVNTTMLNGADQYTDAQLRTELHKIRTGLASSSATVTTFTYMSQIGMTSVTDHLNNTTTYEYDNFRRLILVRDKDNNILKKICYNYAGQPMKCNP
jgi:YD repeat-containing protein